MTILVPITLFGWIPCVLLLFMWMPPRHAVITALMIGWLFLPAATFQLPGIPDYSKMMATSAGILLAALIFDTETLLAFRPKWYDLPMVVFCLCPFVTNSNENIDVYDSFSWSVNQVITWGLPYFIGRVYFTDAQAVRELAIGFFISGLIYIPICVFEMRMSPQLSKWIYGFDSGFSGSRLGGWRPAGFLASGLMLGMWMISASLSGLWLWYTGSLKQVRGRSAGKLVFALIVVTILCRTTGALILFMLGLGCLFTIRWTRVALPFLVLCLPALVYPLVRAGNTWDGSQLVALAENTVGAERAQSVRFRFKNENILGAKALRRFWWGWGRFGRSRVFDENGKDVSTTDGLWIITFGQQGAVGLGALTLIYVVPGILFWWRSRGADWSDPSFAAMALFSVILALYSVDNILNAMLNPVITVCMGAVSGARLRRTNFAAAPIETVVEEPVYGDPNCQRALWPPVPAERVQANAAMVRSTEGKRQADSPRQMPSGPHWRR
jgi:hypothetical protein